MNAPSSNALAAAAGHWLIVCAAPTEARAVGRAFDEARFSATDSAPVRWDAVPLGAGVDLLVCGVGKANAAAGVARVLDPARYGVVLCLGVAGALPRSKLQLGQAVLATHSAYADEGFQTPGGFTDIARRGFGPGMGTPVSGVSIPCCGALRDRLRALADREGVVAAVSTCSGRDRLGVKVVERTGAVAEAMEGAAVGFTVARIAYESGTPISFGELRVISNFTGNPARQRWDLDGALARLGRIAAEIGVRTGR